MAGDVVKIPTGWQVKLSGSVCNSETVFLKWFGPQAGSETIHIGKTAPDQYGSWQTTADLKPGNYLLTAQAGDATSQVNFQVLETVVLEIELVDEDNAPQANVPYQLTLSNGEMVSGTLNDKGYAQHEGQQFKDAKITFTEIDASEWLPH